LEIKNKTNGTRGEEPTRNWLKTKHINKEIKTKRLLERA
jgi:hypothetical protein